MGSVFDDGLERMGGGRSNVLLTCHCLIASYSGIYYLS